MNIFKIEQDLQDIFYDIEENGGEITPEIEEKLQIVETNFSDKLSSYVNVINKYKADVDVCKKEKNRIDAIKKTKENIVERLNKVMLSAVEQFGQTGKSGNKVVELPTCKLYTKSTTTYEYNLDIINQILECAIEWLTGLWMNDMLDNTKCVGFPTGDVTKAINRFYESKYPEDAAALKEEYGELFTDTDIENIRIKVEGECSLNDLLKSVNWDFINMYLNHRYDTLTPSSIYASPNKDMIKLNIKNDIVNKYTKTCKTSSLIIK